MQNNVQQATEKVVKINTLEEGRPYHAKTKRACQVVHPPLSSYPQAQNAKDVVNTLTESYLKAYLTPL